MSDLSWYCPGKRGYCLGGLWETPSTHGHYIIRERDGRFCRVQEVDWTGQELRVTLTGHELDEEIVLQKDDPILNDLGSSL